jgi:transposase
MQGKHIFQPQTKTVIDLESFIAENHFLRRIDRILEISFVHDLTAARYALGMGRSSEANHNFRPLTK